MQHFLTRFFFSRSLSLALAVLSAAPLFAEDVEVKEAATAPTTPTTSTASTKTDQAAGHKGDREFTNALADETSPYLLLHAHNPVNWYGWNEESLALAKKENKPIFLSVGYSSCHWCHVMERESFLDKEIAKYMNDHFVCIKVDREERPDIDAIYLESLFVYQSMSRQPQNGGWPLSMFLTPDGEPFFGGVYFPARDGDRGERTGFFTILQKINGIWSNNEARVRRDASAVATNTKTSLTGRLPKSDAKLSADWITKCSDELQDGFDPVFGGFRFMEQNPDIPKFPEPSNLLFLIAQIRELDAQDSTRTGLMTMLTKTCDRMMMGGLQDHLGGGFHRYSVDRFWAIPHFEKMLYDNGQLATTYAEAYELTGNENYRRVVENLLAFVDREMTDEGGAFYSALDAESDGEEGKFYRWEQREVEMALGEEPYKLFASVYGLNAAPNFEQDYFVPQLKKTWEETAKSLNTTVDQLTNLLAPSRERLLQLRDERPRPLTDNKILTSWNGLMISGYADAGRILKNDGYVESAKRAAKFVLENMVTEDGKLYRTSTNGEAKLNAYIDDYACFIQGLLAIHRATGEQPWLDKAVVLQKKQDDLFWDEKEGGYFFTSSDHEALLARAKRPNDGAMPSGNSVSAENLMYLAAKTKEKAYRERARKTAISASAVIEALPGSSPRMLITVGELLKVK